MDFPAPSSQESTEPDAIIVKADEVDEAGADISTISPTATSSESDFNARIENRRAADAQTTSSPKILANAVPSPPRPLPRPILRREGSVPPPPKQPPPAAPSAPVGGKEGNGGIADAAEGKPTDSLSLQQLKKLVGDLPKLEPAAYAYAYEETRGFEEEVAEWFGYTEDERLVLLRGREGFEDCWDEWIAGRAKSWIGATEEDRKAFVQETMKDLESEDGAARVKSLECLSYIALGAWGDTEGIQSPSSNHEKSNDASQTGSDLQVQWIFRGTELLSHTQTVRRLSECLERLWNSELEFGEQSELSEEAFAEMKLMKQLEAHHTLTTLYLLIEASRCLDDKTSQTLRRNAIQSAKPNILLLLTRIIAKLRWEDTGENSCIPRHKLLLLFWKSLLFLFGQSKDVEACKITLSNESGEPQGTSDEKFITASPLDYHLFRQEITSKYPAYSPPPPLVPIEPDNNTILPPLPNHPSRQTSQDNLNVSSNTVASGSIFIQPVHIATPAPSPPPSPAGPGGKGGKKQNYQTNQNFPFLYPPLDESSNSLGGKGSAELKDKVVSRRWEGSDVPASILEAGQLFASRMRMSRSLRQLWDVREQYIKEERGWGKHNTLGKESEGEYGSSDDESSSDAYSDDDKKPKANHLKASNESNRTSPEQVDADREGIRDEETRRRLNAIDDYYRNALPDLQSLVLVLVMKELLNAVSDLHAKGGSNGQSNSAEDDGAEKRKTNPNSSANLNAMTNGHISDKDEEIDPAVETLNDVRIREISTKAVSGIVLIMLKWFKLSHVLKYEYLTQLLLDASCLPLVLKYFGFQDVDRAVEQKNDREDLDFFAFCHQQSKNPPPSPPQPALSPSDSDSDEAAPPPIRKHRRSPTTQSPPPSPPPPLNTRRPEVDELGFPAAGSTIPQTPLTNYAPRFFLTNINLLRILQKITKRKAHRALLLVQCKSSTILRKALKIPQPDLRLYTLKMFKSQVPYCGRKWRQTNMRVITAIYLHCRPELRDEWLCGGDVDGVVEEAVPVEQAGRSLVHWWHLREFRDVMEGSAGKDGGKGEDYDFFARELEKMGWDFAAGEEEQQGEGNGEGGNGGGGAEFEGGPLRVEGWA